MTEGQQTEQSESYGPLDSSSQQSKDKPSRDQLISVLGGKFAYKFNQYMLEQHSPGGKAKRQMTVQMAEQMAQSTIRERMSKVVTGR